MKKYNLNGRVISVRPEHEQQFLENNPTATLVVGNQGDSNQSANVESQTSAQNPQQENTELKSEDGSSESQEEPDNGLVATLSSLARGLSSVPIGLSSLAEGLEVQALELINKITGGDEWTNEETKKQRALVKSRAYIRSVTGQGLRLSSVMYEPLIEDLSKNIPEFDTSITEDFKKGDIAQAAKRAVDGFAESAASFIAAAVPGGLIVLGASTAGNKYEEEIKENADKDTATLLANAVASGTIEAGFEYFTRGILKKTGLIKTGDTEVAKEFLENSAKGVLRKLGLAGWSMTKEGSSEAATEFTTALLDAVPEQYGGLGKEIDYRQLAYRMSDAFVIGSFSGGVFESVGAVTGTAKTQAESVLMDEGSKAEIENAQDRIAKLSEDLVEATTEEKQLINDQIKLEAQNIKKIRVKNSIVLSNLRGEDLKTYAENVDIINKSKKAYQEAKTDTGKELANNKYKQVLEQNNNILNKIKSTAAAKDVKNIEKQMKLAGLDGKVEQKTSAEIEAMDLGDKVDSKDAAGSFGFIRELPDGSFNIVINKDKPAVGVAAHEFLHAVLSKTLKGDTKVGQSLADALNTHVDTLEGDQSVLKSRLESYKGDENIGEETITLMSESILNGDLKFNENFFTKVGDVVRQFLQSVGIKDVKLDTGRDVYNFIKDYNKSIQEGKTSKAIIKVAKEGAKGKLVEGSTTTKTKADITKFSKEDVKPEVDELGSMGWTKETWKSQGADLAIAEMQANKMLDGLIAAKMKGGLRDGSNDIKKDFISKVYAELTSHVKNFDPESNDSLFGWVNSQISNKAGNVYNREYKDKSLERAVDIDATTSEGAPLVQIEADTDILMEAIDEIGLDETEVEERSRLRRDIRLDEKMMQTVRNAVIKTFGTKLPNVDSKKFRTALEKAFRTELKKPLQDLMGGRSDYDLFLRNHAKAIIKAFPVETLVQMERNLKPEQRIFTESRRITKPTEVDKLISEGKLPKDTNRTSGPQLHTKKSFPGVEKVMAYFRGKDMETVLGYKVGASTLGTRKDKLAMELGVELAFDATAETIQNPEVAEKRQMILELQGIEQLDNELAVIGKQIDRDPSIKFSKQGKSFRLGIGIKNNNKSLFIGKFDEVISQLRGDKALLRDDKAIKAVLKDVYGNDIPTEELTKAAKNIVKYTNEYSKIENKLGPVEFDTTLNQFIMESVEADVLEKGSFQLLSSLMPDDVKTIGSLFKDLGRVKRNRQAFTSFANSLIEKLGQDKALRLILTQYKGMYASATRIGDKSIVLVDGVLTLIPEGDFGTNRGQIFANVKDFYNTLGLTEEQIKSADTKMFAETSAAAIAHQDLTSSEYSELGGRKGPRPWWSESIEEYEADFAVWERKKNEKKRAKEKQAYEERLAQAKEARQAVTLLMDFYMEGIKSGTLDYADLAMLTRMFGSNMNSPMKRAANLAYVDQSLEPLSSKLLGSLAEYEHMVPTNVKILEMVKAYINEGSIPEDLFDDYEVAIIPKAMDKVLIKNGLRDFRPMTYKKGDPNWGRYYNRQTLGSSDIVPLVSIKPKDRGKLIGADFVEASKILLQPKMNEKGAQLVGRTVVKYSKSKGMSTFDFDETLIIDGENFITATDPVTGKELKLSSGEWPIKGPGLAADGFTFDFSDFVNVRGGTDGPLLQKMKNQIKKYGNKNVFVLTARMQDAAGPIHGWLKSKGVDIPFKNITGLGDGRGEAKAEWMLDKFAEGYNDMYFVDDAMPNVDAVKKVLDQLDIKSKVVQAKIKFSKDASKDFNDMLERSKGVASDEIVSAARAKIRGKQVRGTFFVPPSAEDFKGLIYSFLGKGKQGDQDLKWFKENLFDPFSKGTREMDSVKQKMTEEYKAMKKAFPDTIKGLSRKIAGTDFTLDNAIRVYLWKEAGIEVPGLSDKEVNSLWSAVKADPKSEAFAQSLSAMSRQSDGYLSPNAHWTAETIASDLANIVNKVNRTDYLAEWIENKDLVFSSDNLNKIEAIYGTSFREALEDMLHAMETGSNRPTGKDKDVNRFLNWINGSVGAVMFFNTRSAVLQTLSTVNFLNFEDNNIFSAAKAFANQKQFWSDFSMIFNSDMLKQRRAGLKIDVSANELTEAFSKGKSKTEAVIAHLLQLGFTPTQLADSFAIAMGGSTFYRNRVKKYLKEGKSQKDAESKAFLDFQEIAEETQQSSRPDLISKQQRGVLGRIILAWANTPMQMTRLTKKALSDLVNRRGDTKANISRIIYYGVAQNIIFGTLQTGLAFLAFGSEEEEEKTDAKQLRMVNGVFDTLLRGTGVWGAAASTLKNVIMQLHEELGKGFGKKDWSRISQKIFDLSPPLGTKHRKIMNAIKTYDYNKDVIKKMDHGINNPGWNVFTNVVEGLTNAPIARVLNKAQNLKLALQANIETWQRVAIGLGWSAWSVGVEDQEIKEAKAEVKQDRKAESNKRAKEKKAENDADKQKEKQSKGLKKVRCSGIKSDGNRCSIRVETKNKSAKCTYHKAFKPGSDSDGDGKKEYRCKALTSSGNRCRNRTENKNKKCYAHQ